jgi:hypothetical protein
MGIQAMMYRVSEWHLNINTKDISFLCKGKGAQGFPFDYCPVLLIEHQYPRRSVWRRFQELKGIRLFGVFGHVETDVYNHKVSYGM